jgi:predicted transcriptional regulator/DNA-binding XRE family transcriptional regulator
MARAPIGLRIRQRRQEIGLTQTALAARAGISPSYLNLIEHNRRAIGGALLNRLASALDLDGRALAGTEEARMIAELAEIAADPAFAGGPISAEDARTIVATSPVAARGMLALYRAFREMRSRAELIGERLGEDSFVEQTSYDILTLTTTIRSFSGILMEYGDISEAERRRFVEALAEESERLAAQAGAMFDFMSGRSTRRPQPSPREEVEDFVADRANYFPRLEAAAETVLAEIGTTRITAEVLQLRLSERHHVAVERASPEGLPAAGLLYLEGERRLLLAETLPEAAVRFRLARLVGEIEHRDPLDTLTASANPSSADAAAGLRRALANYFAAALIMPYEPFRAAAEAVRYDITYLERRFAASFEEVCHRLATLRRPGVEGVPLHFVKTDIAGNLSKRFSASGLRLPRYGGACPRWILHQAFATPGRIVSQIAALPEGDSYLFVARTTGHGLDHGVVQSHGAVMIGASAAHARRFVYADGLDIASPAAVTQVGVTCRQCPREDCGQRAFDRARVPAVSLPLRPPMT